MAERNLTNTYISDYRKKQRQPKPLATAELTDEQLSEIFRRGGDRVALNRGAGAGITAEQRDQGGDAGTARPVPAGGVLRRHRGLASREIAEIMQIPGGTVVHEYTGGRRQLRHLLAGYTDTVA